MTKDEELQQLRSENTALREALQRKDEELQHFARWTRLDDAEPWHLTTP